MTNLAWGRRISGVLLVLFVCALLSAPSVIAQDEEADRDYWVARYDKLKNDVEELRTRVDTLETKYNRAKRRNYPRGAQLDELRSSLETSRTDLAEAEEAWANFDDDARRAGALPGWFRE